MIKLRALAVDDDPAIRGLVRHILSRAGFDVAEACDGVEAVERLADESFDVVLLDVMMPRLDGLGVIRSVAASRPELLRKIILVTAAHMSTLRDQPVFSVVPKPFDIDALAAEALRCVRETANTPLIMDDPMSCRSVA